jgi:hypothetical protein
MAHIRGRILAAIGCPSIWSSVIPVDPFFLSLNEEQRRAGQQAGVMGTIRRRGIWNSRCVHYLSPFFAAFCMISDGYLSRDDAHKVF